MQIHVDRGGERFGPYSLEEVNRYLADGTLMSSDIGWHEGAADWMPLTKIAGVVAGGRPPGPPAPTAADAAGASGPPAAPTAADAAQPKAPQGTEGAAPESGKSKGGALKIVAIVLLLAGLGAGGYFFIYPKYFAKGGGGDNNGTSGAGAWQTLPGGAPIMGGADVIFHVKAGEIFNSPLVKNLMQNSPNAMGQFAGIKEMFGLGLEDVVDLTVSASGITKTALSVKNFDDSDFEDAFENAFDRGFRPKDADLKGYKGKTDMMICGVLRLSKDLKADSIMTKLEEAHKRGNDTRIRVLKNRGEPVPKELENNNLLKKTHAEKTYYGVIRPFKPDEPKVGSFWCFPDPKTVVIGPESMVIAYIDSVGKMSPRKGLEFLGTKQQIVAAFVPEDTTLIGGKIDEGLKQIPFDEVPPQLSSAVEAFKKMAEALKKTEAATFGGGVTENDVQLVASANFSDADTAKGFVDNFNKLLKDAQQIPEVAQGLLAAQGVGVMVPSAKSKEKQASLTLAIPMDAMDSLGGMLGGLAGNGGGSPGGGGSARHSQVTLKRWALLKQTVGNNQWPGHTIVQKNLGKADNTQQNVTMNTRLVLTAGAAMPTLRNTPQVPGCIRWDYFDAPKGQRAIHLYFNPKNGQMIGVHWFESGPRKIGIPGAGSGGGRPVRPGGNRPNGTRSQGGQKGFPGGNTKGGFRPNGSRPNSAQRSPLRDTAGQATSNSPPQSAAEAQQRLKGSWVRTTGSEVTLTFGDNNRFSTNAGSGPKTGNYRIIGVSGNNITFTGLHSANIASLTLNGPGEFTVRQSSMLGVIPKGTFKRK